MDRFRFNYDRGSKALILLTKKIRPFFPHKFVSRSIIEFSSSRYPSVVDVVLMIKEPAKLELKPELLLRLWPALGHCNLFLFRGESTLEGDSEMSHFIYWSTAPVSLSRRRYLRNIFYFQIILSMRVSNNKYCNIFELFKIIMNFKFKICRIVTQFICKRGNTIEPKIAFTSKRSSMNKLFKNRLFDYLD